MAGVLPYFREFAMTCSRQGHRRCSYWEGTKSQAYSWWFNPCVGIWWRTVLVSWNCCDAPCWRYAVPLPACLIEVDVPVMLKASKIQWTDWCVNSNNIFNLNLFSEIFQRLYCRHYPTFWYQI